MPRVKKIDLAEENVKLSSEIAKAEAKIAEAKAKMKENNDIIQREKIERLTGSGFSLDEILTLIEAMAKKDISVNDMLSLIDESPATEKKSDISDTQIDSDTSDELTKMMASLPSCD